MASQAEASHPQPDEKLVQVFDTQQEQEALVVQSLLGSAGIEALLLPANSPDDGLPGIGGFVGGFVEGFVVKVLEDKAEDARRILAEYQTDDTTVAEEAEDEWEATPHDPKP